MPNALFDKGRKRYLECTTSVAWLTATIQFVLIDTSAYTVNLSTHEYYSDVSGSAVIAGPVSLANKATDGGAADGDDVRFNSVSGASIEAILGFASTGTASTSPLILWIDTANGLPITPNSGDIIVSWDNGPNRIFKL